MSIYHDKNAMIALADHQTKAHNRQYFVFLMNNDTYELVQESYFLSHPHQLKNIVYSTYLKDRNSDFECEVTKTEVLPKYILRSMKVKHLGDRPFQGLYAYSLTGQHIGTPEFAKHLCEVIGITPELKLSSKISPVCCLGFHEEQQKWYGWSPRAMAAFGISDIVEEGDVLADARSIFPLGFVATTLDEAKAMAIEFSILTN